MSRKYEHIDTWWKYVKSNVTQIEEKAEITAGREAEILLRNIVDEHYKFKNCHSFFSKRVYNPEVGYKNEIDLIVVTEKQLYVLECKNWGGVLTKEDDKWVQRKMARDNSNKIIVHDNVVDKNEAKKRSLLNYIENMGIRIANKNCTQKVIFMNKNLRIDSKEIYSNESVITPDRLDSYLNKQENRLKFHERFFSSIINILLDDESSAKVVDGLFERIGGKDFNKLVYAISSLPTWDKVILYGTKIISGDIRKSDNSIFRTNYGIPFKDIKKIKIKIVRSKGLSLIKSILAIGRPISLELYGASQKIIKTTDGNPDGFVRIQPAGSQECIDLPIFQIEEIIYGKF